MKLKFWKKNADDGDDAETPAKPGLTARIKLRLAALVRSFKKPPAFYAEEVQAPDVSEQTESVHDDTPSAKPVNFKKRLIIGTAVALLIVILAGVGFAAWKIFLLKPEQKVDTSAKTLEIHHTDQPVPQAVLPSAEIEELKKRNDELQAQVEKLKKEQLNKEQLKKEQLNKEPLQQSHAASAVKQANNKIPPSPVSGEIMVGNEDPKGSAMTLKEAIKAMNRGSGN